MKVYILSATDISYSITMTNRNRRMVISIREDKVRVSAPKAYPVNQVKAFVESKRSWIIEQLAQTKNIQSRRRERELTDKEVISYKKLAREVFASKLEKYAKEMGLTYNSFRIKEQKTRWGSCSSKGNINLNWRLIQAPEEVINYVIVHELAHLRYMNHSHEFWQLVSQYSPDYQKWRDWLRKARF